MARYKLAAYVLSVFYRVKRNISRLSGTFSLAVAPLGLKFLDKGGVLKHNIAQTAGGSCGINIS